MKDTEKIIDFELEKKVLEEVERIEKKTGRKVSERGKEIIREKIQERERRQQRNENFKKAGIVLGAIGIGAAVIVAGGDKEPVEQPNTGIEETDNSNKEEVKEAESIEEIVGSLENKDEVLRFLKNMYLEKREQQIGDDTLTTEDITITENYENYIYEDIDTGNMYLHGAKPAEIEEKLENQGINWDTKDNIKVYKVETKEGNVLDCITFISKDGESVPVPVHIDGQYNESVLAKMGPVARAGVTLAENMNSENKKGIEANFIRLLEQMEEESVQIEDDEMEI